MCTSASCAGVLADAWLGPKPIAPGARGSRLAGGKIKENGQTQGEG